MSLALGWLLFPLLALLVLLSNCTTNIFRSYVGTIVLMTVENTNFATKIGLLISYYITMSFWAAQTLGLSMVSRNIGGATKKSVVIATTFVSWAVGNSIGTIPPFYLSQFRVYRAIC